MKKILMICFLLSCLFSCSAEITDPVVQESQAPVGDSDFDEWDPSQVLVPGINLLTFTDGDRDTTWPYYKSNATHKIKFQIVSGTSTVAGSVDPGLYSVKLEVSANSGTTWTTITGAASLPSTVGTESTFNWGVSSTTYTDGVNYLIRATATNASNKTVTVKSSRTFTIDGTAPTINFLGLSSGTLGVVSVGSPTDPLQAKVVNRSFFETSIAASDTTTVIKFICVKAFDAIAPAVDDSCWQDLGDSASKSLTKIDISTFVGFVQNTYQVSIWAMDFAGNMSSLTNGTGVESKDKITIAYNPAVAPTITNMIASTNDSSSQSPSKSETTFSLNQDVFVRWNVTDTDLLTAPISLYYTLDEENFIEVPGAQNITNVSVGCSPGASFTGCRKIAAPSDKYFKIQIKVKDQSGLVSLSATPALNTDKFSIVAGNTDLGINGSANKAIFLSQVRAADVPGDFGTLAVSSKGKVYFMDATRGVLLVDPVDGVQKVFLEKGSTKTGDGGPVSMATTIGNGKITIDYQDRLLIFDGDRIRRVESDGTINTIIGGGTITTYTKAVAAKSLKFSTSMNMYTLLQVLPNGNIWFTLGNPTAQVIDYTMGIYKAAEDKVYFMKLSGKGVKGDPEYVFTTDYIRTIALSFNYRTSQPEFLTTYICFPVPGGCGHKTANFNARNGISVGYGTHAPAYAYWETQMFASRRGAIYWLGAHYPFQLGKYNVATNQWNTVVGGATQGYCADGAVASACKISGIDAFVDGTNTVYFNDAGQIRVILPDGKLKTLFGERKSAGDGSSPLAARMNGVNYMGVWGTSDTVVAADNKEFNIREITQGAAGSINRLAGNYTDDSVNFEPAAENRYSTNAASASSFANEFWGGIQGVQVDPRDGTFYASLTRNGVVVKYEKNAATGKAGKWKLVLGAGGTADYLSTAANGVAGKNISMNGYPLVLHGIMVPDGATSATAAVEAGTSEAYLVGWTQVWNGTCHVNAFAKIFNSTSGTVRKFMGADTAGVCLSDSTFQEGVDISNSVQMPYWGNATMSSVYLKEERALLMANLGAKRIIKAPILRNGSDQIIGAGVSSVFATTSRTIKSFTYKKNASSQYELYYCAYDGTLNKKNLTTGVETNLPLPTSTSGNKFFTCDGSSISWDYNKQQVYFPFRQNGLSGVGKYCVTTTGTCP
ncbi:hypothetical protein CIK05_13640 [Bdellovibrio sp. qaytius]|nr:hypothetical protein CIK05_13640 [Bdellovibrio sp. qaytius]